MFGVISASGQPDISERGAGSRLPRASSFVGRWSILHYDPVMPSFLYRCPNTGYPVQGYRADEALQDNEYVYEPALCIMCQQIHHVNVTTGKVVGEDDAE